MNFAHFDMERNFGITASSVVVVVVVVRKGDFAL
jgi:hypothetical protein